MYTWHELQKELCTSALSIIYIYIYIYMNALFRLLLLALSQNVGCETNYKCTIHKLPYLCPSLPVTPPE